MNMTFAYGSVRLVLPKLQKNGGMAHPDIHKVIFKLENERIICESCYTVYHFNLEWTLRSIADYII